MIDAATIKDFLDKYYQGLSAAVGRRKQLASDVSQINAEVTPAQSGGGVSSYKATVIYFDTFNDGRKIVLNVEIKVMARPGAKRTFITLLISPQPLDAEVWKKLHEIGKTIHLEGS